MLNVTVADIHKGARDAPPPPPFKKIQAINSQLQTRPLTMTESLIPKTQTGPTWPIPVAHTGPTRPAKA